MIYNKQLPDERELSRLMEAITHYPIEVSALIDLAHDLRCSDELIDFLQLFRVDGSQFSSRDDFESRTSELELIIAEEREQSREGLLRE